MNKYEGNKLFKILNEASDWIIRVIIVNVLTIIMMLPLITFIPALTSGYKIMSDALNKDEAKLFTSFFKTFKEEIGKKLSLSVIVIIIIGLSFYNNRLYAQALEAGKGIFYNIGYYLTLVLIIGTSMVTMYLPLVLIERKEAGLKEIMKLSFYLSGKYFFKTFLIALVVLIPILMFLTPVTIFLFIFMGVSVPLLLIALLTKKTRIYLKESSSHD